MVGVGEQCMFKELPDGRKLSVHMQWESDRNLIDGVTTIHGTLPGAGCLAYMLMVTKTDDDLDEDSLQEFNFRGGGDQKSDDVPPVVREAFEEWYAKLSQTRVLRSPASLTIQFVGSAKTKEGADYALTCLRSFTKRGEPFQTFDLTPEKAEEVRKEHEALQALRSKVMKEEGTEDQGKTGTAEPESVGPRRDSDVKGLSIRVHPDVKEINLAFLDYGDCWVAEGSVKIPISAFEARAPVLKMLDWLSNLDVELEVKEVWFEADRNARFEWRIAGRLGKDEYNADAAARGENPYYPGLPAAPPGGYRFPNPTGVWKTEARAWLNSHPSTRPIITKEEVEALYAAGATNVDITFESEVTGLEATPPVDKDARGRIIEIIKSYHRRDEGWGEDEEAWAGEVLENSDTKPWVVF